MIFIRLAGIPNVALLVRPMVHTYAQTTKNISRKIEDSNAPRNCFIQMCMTKDNDFISRYELTLTINKEVY